MKTPHKHAALIKAWADGAEIEYSAQDSVWYHADSPDWDEDCAYRIKPYARPVTILEGLAHLEDGTTVNLRDLQERLVHLFYVRGIGDAAYAAEQLSKLTGKTISAHGDWVDA